MMILYPFCIGFSVKIHGIDSDFSVSIEKGYFCDCDKLISSYKSRFKSRIFLCIQKLS